MTPFYPHTLTPSQLHSVVGADSTRGRHGLAARAGQAERAQRLRPDALPLPLRPGALRRGAGSGRRGTRYVRRAYAACTCSIRTLYMYMYMYSMCMMHVITDMCVFSIGLAAKEVEIALKKQRKYIKHNVRKLSPHVQSFYTYSMPNTCKVPPPPLPPPRDPHCCHVLLHRCR